MDLLLTDAELEAIKRRGHEYMWDADETMDVAVSAATAKAAWAIHAWLFKTDAGLSQHNHSRDLSWHLQKAGIQRPEEVAR